MKESKVFLHTTSCMEIKIALSNPQTDFPWGFTMADTRGAPTIHTY